MSATRPSKQELEAARSRELADVIAPELDVVFCGINPGLYSAAVGYHFGRPGNRFWPVLHGSGFTERRFDPSEQELLLDHGCGITNLVGRTTAAASELSAAELQAGAVQLEERMRRYRPRVLAVLGIGAFRAGFGVKRAAIGRQDLQVGETDVWVLPNTSGLNAHYQLPELVRLFAKLRTALKSAL
jgi:TDG/mug DNA glycosylase family protein